MALPARQDALYLGPHASSTLRSAETGHQQLVILGFGVPHRGGHCERERFGVEVATGCGPADAATPARTGVAGDCLGPLLRATRVKAQDLPCRLRLKLDIL